MSKNPFGLCSNAFLNSANTAVITQYMDKLERMPARMIVPLDGEGFAVRNRTLPSNTPSARSTKANEIQSNAVFPEFVPVKKKIAQVTAIVITPIAAPDKIFVVLFIDFNPFILCFSLSTVPFIAEPLLKWLD